MQYPGNALEGKNSTGNRIGHYSRQKIEEILKQNTEKSLVECREMFLDEKIQYISYPCFSKIAKQVIKNRDRKNTLYYKIEEFLSNKTFSSYSDAYKEFKKESGNTTSYAYFWANAKKIDNSFIKISPKKITNNTASKSAAVTDFINTHYPIENIKKLWEQYNDTSKNPVSYTLFFRLIKKAGIDNKKPIQNPTNRNIKKQFVDTFLKDRTFYSIAAAHKSFKQESGVSISYIWFCKLVDRSKIVKKVKKSTQEDSNQKQKEITPGTLVVETKRQKKKKEFKIPSNVDEIQKSWHSFINKNVRNILKKKFHTVDEETTRDYVNEVYIDLCKYYSPEKYNPEKGSFTNWLYFIVRNCVYRLMKEKNQDALNHSVSYNETLSEDSDIEKIDFLNISTASVPANSMASGTNIHPDFAHVIGESASFTNSEDIVDFNMVVNNFMSYISEVDNEISNAVSNDNKSATVSFTSTVLGDWKAPVSSVSYSDMFTALNNDYTIKTLSLETGIAENKLSNQKRSLFKAYSKIREG